MPLFLPPALSVDNYVVCTSSTRPSSPYEGLMIYETDTNKVYIYGGASWSEIVDLDAWSTGYTNYTPTLTATTTSPTLGSGSAQDGRYMRMGQNVTGWGRISFGTSGAAAGSGTYRFSLPVTPRTEAAPHRIIGQGWIFDSSAVAVRTITAELETAGNAFATMRIDNAGATAGIVTDNAPFVWANSDIITIEFTYEAA